MKKIMLVVIVVLTMGVGSACSDPVTPDTTPEYTTATAQQETTSAAVIQYESTHELPKTGGPKIMP